MPRSPDMSGWLDWRSAKHLDTLQFPPPPLTPRHAYRVLKQLKRLDKQGAEVGPHTLIKAIALSKRCGARRLAGILAERLGRMSPRYYHGRRQSDIIGHVMGRTTAAAHLPADG
eukprot:Hpha_TRINITY_DN34596_c0_g1::TRINITY_DN34596_c0_g1_i1::g.96291::m.96291